MKKIFAVILLAGVMNFAPTIFNLEIFQNVSVAYAEISDNEFESTNKTHDGIFLANNKNYKEAIKKFTEAIKLNPNNADAYFQRGKAYYDLENYLQVTSFQQGKTHKDLKNYEKAISDFSKAIELEPNKSNLYSSRAFTYEKLENYEKAILDFTKVIELNPNDSGWYLSRGNAYQKLKKYEQAIADYNKAIELKPDDSIAYFFRGFCYQALGENEKAKADFAKSEGK